MLKQFTSKKNLLLKFTPALLIVIMLIFLARHYFSRPSSTGHLYIPPEKVVIAYAPTNSVLAQVAHARGYYLQEGLQAKMVQCRYGKAALKKVLEGQADFAISGETPIMFAIMSGEKISVIATIQTSARYNAIVARRDRGILNPADLKGKRIATSFGTTAHFFMHSFLAVHGISRKDVQVIDLTADELQNALLRGEVDAVSTLNPFLIQIRNKLGKSGTTFYDENIYTETFNVTATQDSIQKNPGRVKKLLRALIKAEFFAGQHPDEAQAEVAAFNRMDIALIRAIWEGNSYNVSLGQALVLALEDESQWAIKNNLTDETLVPNYLDFMYLDGLESAKPEAVRILR